jgi:nitrogen regulatory protein P-II 1
MSESNIAILTDVVLITCVVDNGKAEEVVKAARGAGAGGALIHSSRGIGIRERVGLLGIAMDTEKDVIELMVGSDQAEMVAHTIFNAVELGRPGGGYIYLTPLDAAATYLPQEIRDRLEEKKL